MHSRLQYGFEKPYEKLIPWSLLMCLAAFPAFGANTVVEEIVARINNRIVTLSTLSIARM